MEKFNNLSLEQTVSPVKVVMRNASSKARLKRKRSSLILEPLYTQVTNFVRDAARKRSRRGKRSKKSDTLMTEIHNALHKLIKVGRGIALDYREVRVEMSSACRSVELLGSQLKSSAVDFLTFPCSPIKRQDMVRAADSLLSGVTRMLYIADIADALRLQASLKQVDRKLTDLNLSKNTNDLIKSFRRLGTDLLTVTNLTSDIEDMSDPEKSRDLEAACNTLRKTGETLEFAPKKYDQNHPGLQDIRNDYYDVLQQVIGATDIISNVLNPEDGADTSVQSIINDIITHFVGTGSLKVERRQSHVEIFKFSEALTNLDEKIDISSCVYSDMAIRTEVQRSLNKIIKEAAVVADISGVKEKTRSTLLQSCFRTTDAVRNAIAQNTDADSDVLDENEFQRQAIVGIARETTKELRKSVLDALLDHISSKYKGIEKLLSLGMLLSNEENDTVQEYIGYMKEVSRLTTFLSEDDEMKNNIDNAVKRLSHIRKEVVAASEVLVNSKKRLTTCKASWQSNVETLKRAVRNIDTENSLNQDVQMHIPGRSHSAARSTDYNCSGMSSNDDNYWWDSTTDTFAPRSHSSSSAVAPSNSPDHFFNSDDGTEFSNSFGVISDRISERFQPTIRRTLTPQPRALSPNQQNRALFTPQPIRRSYSQSSEPYSPHPRHRFRSSNYGKQKFGSENLQMAVSDMQVNIAPKLASVLCESKARNKSCNDNNHTMIVDSLKLVYKGIQTICNALLDEDQFTKPNFNLKVPNSTSNRELLYSPDDYYYDKELIYNNNVSGKLWSTSERIQNSTNKNSKETSL